MSEKKERTDYDNLPWDEIMREYEFGQSTLRPGRRPSQTELANRYNVGCRKIFGQHLREQAKLRNIYVRPREKAAGMPAGVYSGTGSNRRARQQ